MLNIKEVKLYLYIELFREIIRLVFEGYAFKDN